MGRAFSVMAGMPALAALAAACSGSAPPSTQGTATSPAAHPAPVSTRCGRDAPSQVRLRRVTVAMTTLPGAPDGVTTTGDGRWAFASLQGGEGRISVSSSQGLAPRLVRTIPVPAGGLSGLAVTHDGRLLLAATDRGAVVVSVPRATGGGPGAALGALTVPARGASAAGGGAEVAVSPDDHFAFVTLERAGGLAVFDLRTAAADGFRHNGYVGMVPLGIAPLGVAVSPDGRELYVTSEQARGPAAGSHGSLTMIDVARAETDPGHAVVAVGGAPCHPVRVAPSPDGRVVWVTARTGNELLGFSVSQLLKQPQRALVAAVRVGEEPIGLGVVDGGRRVVVADSNLFGKRGATAQLSIVDTAAALAGKPALIGSIGAGKVPSEIAVEPGGRTLLVGNSSSNQLEAVDVTAIP